MPPDEATVRALVDVCVGVVLAATNSATTANALIQQAMSQQLDGWIPMAKAPGRPQ